MNEVIDFFARCRISLEKYRPHSALPSPNDLETLLRLHDINGSTLLSDIDTTALREDFLIRSFGQRSTFIYAIKQLRQKSPKYQIRLPVLLEKTVSSAASPPISHDGLNATLESPPLPVQRLDQLLLTSPLPHSTQIGEPSGDTSSKFDDYAGRVRPGEELVEDEHGRKRRKLTLHHSDQPSQVTAALNTNYENTIPSAAAKEGSTDLAQYFEQAQSGADRDRETHDQDITPPQPSTSGTCAMPQTFYDPKATSIDGIFYGRADIGQIVDEKPYDTAIAPLIHNGSHSGSDDEFQVHSRGKVCGADRLFVDKRLRYYFLKAEQGEVSIEGTMTLGIYPYPEQLLQNGSRRSVTVFKPTTKGFDVIRDDALLPGQANLSNGPQIEDWDYLAKWKNEDDTVLPEFGDSGSDAGFSSGLMEEIQQEEQEEEEARSRKKGPLSKERAAEIIEEEILKSSESWKNRKLPLRKSNARSIWFKAGGSHRRALLISSTNAEIERLNTRAAKLKDNIVEEVWMKDSEVRRQCEILEETIFQLEDNRFKKSVWQSKSAPAAIKKPKTKRKEAKHRCSADEESLDSDLELEEAPLDDFIVPDDPSTALENTRPDAPPETVSQGSPTMPMEDDPMLVEDDSRRDDPVTSAEDVSTDEKDKSAQVSDNESTKDSPLAEDEKSQDSETVPMDISSPTQEHKSLDPDPMSTDGSSEPDNSDRLPNGDTMTDPLPSTETSDVNSRVKSEASLPEEKNNSAVVIDLDPSDDEVKAVEEDNASKDAIIYDGAPEEATRDDVASWCKNDLVERNDRKRLIMQILLTRTPAQYDVLGLHILTSSQDSFTDAFQIAIMVLKHKDRTLFTSTFPNIDTMTDFVKLYACWTHCIYKYWENEAAESLQEELSDALAEDLRDYNEFYAFVKGIFKRHKEPIIFHFSSPDKDFKNPLDGRQSFITIDTTSESGSETGSTSEQESGESPENLPVGPSRRKIVAQSQDTKDKIEKAHQRQKE